MWACYLWVLTDVRSSVGVFALLALDLWLVLQTGTLTHTQGYKSLPGPRTQDSGLWTWTRRVLAKGHLMYGNLSFLALG